MAVIENHKSSIADLNANIVALITYAGASGLGFLGWARYGAWLIPLVIYLLEKKSKFVKKNAIQSLTLNIFGAIIYIVLGIISSLVMPRWVADKSSWLGGKYVGSLTTFNAINTITIILGVVIAVLSIIAIIKAWSFEEYDMPVISKFTAKVKKVLDKICNNTEEVVAEEVKKEEN